MWPKCSKEQQNWWFWGLDFDPLLGLILEVFGEPKRGPKPSKRHFKKTSKKWCPKWAQTGPKGVPKWSQNRQKWGLGSILFQGWLPRDSRPPPGSILERFWHYFGSILVCFADTVLLNFACILWQHVANKNVQNHKESPKNKWMQQRASKNELLSSCPLALNRLLANVNELFGPC